MNHDGWMACDESMTCDEWRSSYEWTNYDEWITRHKWKTCEWHVMSQEASAHDASCTCSSLQAALVAAYLNCITPFPMLANAHSFKDKSSKLSDVNAGLFTYPILMASDILLYQADLRQYQQQRAKIYLWHETCSHR